MNCKQQVAVDMKTYRDVIKDEIFTCQHSFDFLTRFNEIVGPQEILQRHKHRVISLVEMSFQNSIILSVGRLYDRRKDCYHLSGFLKAIKASAEKQGRDRSSEGMIRLSKEQKGFLERIANWDKKIDAFGRSYRRARAVIAHNCKPSPHLKHELKWGDLREHLDLAKEIFGEYLFAFEDTSPLFNDRQLTEEIDSVFADFLAYDEKLKNRTLEN